MAQQLTAMTEDPVQFLAPVSDVLSLSLTTAQVIPYPSGLHMYSHAHTDTQLQIQIIGGGQERWLSG